MKLNINYILGLKILKWVGIVFLFLFTVVIIILIYAGYYFDNNKSDIETKILKELDANITGDIKISDIDYKFLSTLPNFTLVLKNVKITDTLYAIHKRPFLLANEINVHLNVFSLLKKEINFNKIAINNAKIDMFKDINGVKNSDIFKKKEKKPDGSSSSSLKIQRIDLNNVVFISENQQRNKLFHFNVASVRGRIKYTDYGWRANVNVKTHAKSMAFNQLNGGFIRDKIVIGSFVVSFTDKTKNLAVKTNKLQIGDDKFNIKANFGLQKENQLFNLDIRTNILWKNAYSLLPNSIFNKLKKFDVSKTLIVHCMINGNMAVQGDPNVLVKAFVKKTVLKIPDGVFTDCNFQGTFNNHYVKGKGANDLNSIIIIKDLTGVFNGIPVEMPITKIFNLKKPVANGNIKADFDIKNLNKQVDKKLFTYKKGKAKIDLAYNLNIVGFRVNKPTFTGTIDIKDAHVVHNSTKQNFVANINLKFIDDGLLIDNINYKSKKTNLTLNGKIDDFLNLYYNNPEKIVANLNINSPYLDLREVMAFTKKKATAKAKNKKKSEIGFEEIIDKCEINFKISINKILFSNLLVNSTKFNAKLHNKTISIKNGSFKAMQGAFLFNGVLAPNGDRYKFNTDVNIKAVDISAFLKSFNNFNIKSFEPSNIAGKLSLITKLSGEFDHEGSILGNTLNGNINYSITDGMLYEFKPIVKVGKFAFPNRKVNQITFSEIKGDMVVVGYKVYINDLKVSSSMLNMDVKGVYSFREGTNLGLTIPLRDPADDINEPDLALRESYRYKGIVIHLKAVDGKDGKVKIKWGKRKESL